MPGAPQTITYIVKTKIVDRNVLKEKVLNLLRSFKPDQPLQFTGFREVQQGDPIGRSSNQVVDLYLDPERTPEDHYYYFGTKPTFKLQVRDVRVKLHLDGIVFYASNELEKVDNSHTDCRQRLIMEQKKTLELQEEFHEKYKDQTTKLMTLEEENRDLKYKCSDQSKKLEELENDKRKLLKDCRSLEDKQRSNTNLIKELTGENKTLEARLTVLEEKLKHQERLEEENKMLKATLAELESQNSRPEEVSNANSNKCRMRKRVFRSAPDIANFEPTIVKTFVANKEYEWVVNPVALGDLAPMRRWTRSMAKPHSVITPNKDSKFLEVNKGQLEEHEEDPTLLNAERRRRMSDLSL